MKWIPRDDYILQLPTHFEPLKVLLEIAKTILVADNIDKSNVETFLKYRDAIYQLIFILWEEIVSSKGLSSFTFEEIKNHKLYVSFPKELDFAISQRKKDENKTSDEIIWSSFIPTENNAKNDCDPEELSLSSLSIEAFNKALNWRASIIDTIKKGSVFELMEDAMTHKTTDFSIIIKSMIDKMNFYGEDRCRHMLMNVIDSKEWQPYHKIAEKTNVEEIFNREKYYRNLYQNITGKEWKNMWFSCYDNGETIDEAAFNAAFN